MSLSSKTLLRLEINWVRNEGWLPVRTISSTYRRKYAMIEPSLYINREESAEAE
jgi:hypothetical protein